MSRKNALSIGSSVCVINFFTSPKRWITPGARHILSLPAVVTHDDADITNRHYRLRNQLDRREPAVDEVSTIGEGHVLSTASTAGCQERLGILIVVVIVRIIGIWRNGRCD